MGHDSLYLGRSSDANLSDLYKCNQFPPNGQNALHYCNHQLDGLLEKEKGTYDERKQAELLDRETRIIVADVPTVVLFILDDGYSYNRNLQTFIPERSRRSTTLGMSTSSVYHDLGFWPQYNLRLALRRRDTYCSRPARILDHRKPSYTPTV